MTKPATGDIWRYPYLWKWQHGRGETEGRKDRPVSLVAVIPVSKNETRLYMLAITGTEPGNDRHALEVPLIEKRRAGLFAEKQLWIILDEYNFDILEQSFYFDVHQKIGNFSKAFVGLVASKFKDAIVLGFSMRASVQYFSVD